MELIKVDLACLLNFFYKNLSRVDLEIWVCHENHFDGLLGQDENHEEVDGYSEERAEPRLMGLTAPVVDGYGVAEAISPQQELSKAKHLVLSFLI